MVEDQLRRLRGRSAGQRARRELRGQVVGVREEADAQVRAEQLLPGRRRRDGDEPRERQTRDPRVARAAGLHEDGGRDAQRDGGEHLVRDAEQRPEDVDAAERIDTPMYRK